MAAVAGYHDDARFWSLLVDYRYKIKTMHVSKARVWKAEIDHVCLNPFDGIFYDRCAKNPVRSSYSRARARTVRSSSSMIKMNVFRI